MEYFLYNISFCAIEICLLYILLNIKKIKNSSGKKSGVFCRFFNASLIKDLRIKDVLWIHKQGE